MKQLLVKRTVGCTLGCLILAGICYSTFTLFAPAPAMAATCTPAKCAFYENAQTNFCNNGHGGLKGFICPVDPNHFFYECNDGTGATLPC